MPSPKKHFDPADPRPRVWQGGLKTAGSAVMKAKLPEGAVMDPETGRVQIDGVELPASALIPRTVRARGIKDKSFIAGLPDTIRDEIDRYILSEADIDGQHFTVKRLVAKYGLPGTWTVGRRKEYLRKVAARKAAVTAAVRKREPGRMAERREERRVLQLAEWPMQAARQNHEIAVGKKERVWDKDGRLVREEDAPDLGQANLSIDKYLAGLRLFGEFTGEIVTAGTAQVTGGIHNQVLQIMSLPRLDDPPEAWQALDPLELEAGEEEE